MQRYLLDTHIVIYAVLQGDHGVEGAIRLPSLR